MIKEYNWMSSVVIRLDEFKTPQLRLPLAPLLWQDVEVPRLYLEKSQISLWYNHYMFPMSDLIGYT